MEKFSQDTINIASGLFLNGRCERVGFGMRDSRPSDRCQVALDELVKAGHIIKSDLGRDGVEYRPAEKMKGFKYGKVTRDATLKITTRIDTPPTDD